MKQRRHFIAEAPDGKILFAPLLDWWDIHHAASARRFGDPAYDHFKKRRLCRELNADLKAAGKRPVPWLLVFKAGHPLRKYTWFLDWLLRGKRPPANVTIVPPAILEWAAQAWDYVATCGAAGVSISAYEKSLRAIPSLAALKWYFALGPAPDGLLLLDEPVQKIRFQRSIRRICSPDAARVSRKTWQQWQKDPELKDLVRRAIDAASNGGHRGPLESLPAWKRIGPRGRKSVWNFAKAATISACAAREDPPIHPTVYSAKRAEAKKLGALAAFDKYLAIEDRGKGQRKADMVDPKLFAPRPFALKFHAAAASRRPERPRDLLELQQHPVFHQWFLDSVIPRKMAGRPRALIDGHESNGRAEAVQTPVPKKPRQFKLTVKAAKHLIWRAQRKAGMSFGQIAMAWGELPSEKQPARAAIATALRRVKSREDAGGNLPNELEETKTAFGMFHLSLPSKR
jgi:hypothetical protein